MLNLKSPRHLWRRYAIALVIVLVLLSVSHAASIMALNGSAEATRVINIAGKQHMLSQKILYLAARKRHGDRRAAFLLREAIDEFGLAHDALSRGGTRGLSVEAAQERAPAYFTARDGITLDWLSRRFVADARHVLRDDPQADRAWWRMEMMGSSLLMLRLNDAASFFEQIVQARTETVEVAARASFVLAILVVAGEALFIFLPAQRTVSAALDDLERVNDDLAASKAGAETLLASEQSARSSAEAARASQARFLTYISHELRTPLNGLMGMLTLMGDAPDEADRVEQLRVAQAAAGQMMALVGDTIDLTKLEAGEMRIAPRPVDLREIAAAALSFSEIGAHDAGLALTCRISPDLPDRIVADGERVRQVLVNLLAAAIDAVATGAIETEIDYDPDRPDGQLTIGIGATAGALSEAERDRIFARHAQAAASDGYGPGLGLSISRQMIELMGGRLDRGVDRDEAMFRVTLHCPPAMGRTRGGLGDRARRPAARGVARSVLVVDDNSLNRLVAARYLKGAGHVTRMARDGAEAVAAVREAAFDLVLMDINMPVMDGYEATRAIRAIDGERGRVPIVALTADAMAHDRDRVLAAGLDGYLCKPIAREELLGAIDAAVAGRAAAA